MLNAVTLGNFYRNIKNQKTYVVNALAQHTETMEYMVLYKEIDSTRDILWSRPFDLFLEKFEEVQDEG